MSASPMPFALVPWPASVAPLDAEPLRLGPLSRADALVRARTEATHIADASHGAEGYALDVRADGVRIASGGPAGAFYAERTLAQLMSSDEAGAFLPAVAIRDAPRFAYRGVMLDVARHFHSVETVEAVIDRAASLKFNALHLHLTDDHGWRIEVQSHPELTLTGSSTSVGGDPGGFYTHDDYRRIVSYAADRHMIVVPEIDLPGHTHALGLSHDELVADPVITEHIREVTRDYGGELPERGTPYTALAVGFSSLRADAPGLERFLREVLGEVASLTPGPFLHFGGDEALGTSDEDYRAMAELASRIVADTGKTPIAWHEAGAADVTPGTVGQYWGFVTPRAGHDERLRALVARGGRAILSPADAVYLDMKYDEGTPAGLVWADGPTSVERSYSWDPAAIIPGLDERDILGVEAALWTETIPDLATIDTMAFPRVASAAEAGWSLPAGSPERTWESFRRRVGGLGPAWSDAGIGFSRSPEIPWA